MPRTYDMTNRARGAAETTAKIALATEALLATQPVGEVTLQAIADRAGITVQTVLRHMGSREGCFHAVAERVRGRIDAQRGHTAPGDVGAALDELVAHYEAEGKLVLHLLAQEGSDEFTRRAVEAGRAYHRAWVERCLGVLVVDPDRGLIDALVAATDLYVWKLLRLDLQRSRDAVRAVLDRLVRSLLESAT